MRATILSVMVTTVAFGATGCSKESAPEEGRRTVQPEPRKPAGLESFASLCVGGPAFDGLPRRADGETKKVVTFQKWADDAKPAFARVTPQALASYEPKAASDVGLVACVERKKLDRSRRCSFGQGHYVDYFDMQDHVRIIDPRTGKVVREHDGKTEHRSACPMSYRFTGKSHFDGAPIENRVLSLVLEEQGADAPLPKMPAKYEMYQVCGGVPYPQLPAYDPKSDDYQAIAYSARGPESYSTSVGRLEDEGEDIRLVACVERKADDTKTSSCAFRGGHELEMRNGDVTIEIREARTAEVLATKTFRAEKRRSCPTIHDFAKGHVMLNDVERGYRAFVESFTGPEPAKGTKKRADAARRSAPRSASL